MAKRALVWLGGEIVAPDQAKVSVFDRGFLFGDGVYETGRTYNRCPIFLEEHLKRLRLSASKLSIPVPWPDSHLKESLFALLKAFGAENAYFRTILTRGVTPYVGLEANSETPPTLVHLVQEISTSLDATREKGISLLTSKIVRNAVAAQDPNIKTSNYLNSLLALQDVRARGADDAILCNASGQVTEGTTFSVFGVTEKGELWTPALDIGILDSITRRHVLEVARKDFPLREGHFPLKEFQTCREVFIASSVREILPVRTWDGIEFPKPWTRTMELQSRLRKAMLDYAASGERY